MKKKYWSVLGVCFILIVVFSFGASRFEKNTEPTKETNNPTTGMIVEENAVTTMESTTVTTEESMPERGTTAMVDYLVRMAKRDSTAADAGETVAAAYEWIVENVPQWYDGAEMMEKAIYNGALVEYYYTGKNNTRASVGMDTVQSVKYVYRGAETVLDEATQENIRQIKEGIKKDQGN